MAEGHPDQLRCNDGTTILNLDDPTDMGWIDGNANHPRHTVPHPKRTPEATAQIAAAREQTGVDDAFEERVRAMNDTSGLRKGLTEEQRIDLALEKQTRGHIDRLRSVLSANRTPAGKLAAVLEEARSGRVPADVARRVLNESPSAPTPRVLTTNHPEITDPAGRERMGLDPLAPTTDRCGLPCSRCGVVLVGMAHVCRPDPIEERIRAAHARVGGDPGPVFAIDDTRPADRTYEMLPPSECGGPKCNHVKWTTGCHPCAEWAQHNGVAFARHMTQGHPPRRITTTGVAPNITLVEERPRSHDERAVARVYERADLALAMGALVRIAKTVLPGAETWTADELQHAVATVKIERDEARVWADRTKPQLEDALAKLRDTSTLEPDDAATLGAFGQTCAALERHAEQGQALQAAYREALQAVSAMAARRNRGR